MERRRETYSPDRHSRKRDRRDRRRDEDGDHEEDQDRRRHSRRRDEEDYADRRHRDYERDRDRGRSRGSNDRERDRDRGYLSEEDNERSRRDKRPKREDRSPERDDSSVQTDVKEDASVRKSQDAEENVEVDEFGRVVTKERKIAANMTQEEKMQGMSEEEQMKMLLGITSFDSTKEKVVEDNQRGPAKGAAALNKKRKFRQYMNRKGGFNRSLDN